MALNEKQILEKVNSRFVVSIQSALTAPDVKSDSCIIVRLERHYILSIGGIASQLF